MHLIHFHSHADFPKMYNRFDNLLAFTMQCFGHVRHKLTGIKHRHDLLIEGDTCNFEDGGMNKFYMYYKVKRKARQIQ